MERLEFFFRNNWFLVYSNKVLAPDDFHFVEWHKVRFENVTTPIMNLVEVLRPYHPTDQLQYDFLLLVEHIKVERLILFKPLVYLLAYGPDDIFELAALAVNSLLAFGNWRGEIVLISDRTADNLRHIFSPAILDRIRFHYIASYATVDVMLNKYKVIEIDFFTQYQPVLYIDADVICDRPIWDALPDFLLSEKIHVVHDSPMSDPGNWYGQNLLADDGVDLSQYSHGISAGVFIFRRIADQVTFFKMIIETVYMHLRYEKGPGKSCDQWIFNYILFKAKFGTTQGIEKMYHLYMNHLPHTHTPMNKGLVHFAGGIGNSSPKLEHMRAYYDVLNHEKDRRALISENIDEKEILKIWDLSQTHYCFVDHDQLWSNKDKIDKSSSINVISYAEKRIAPTYMFPVSNDVVTKRVFNTIGYLDYLYRRAIPIFDNVDSKSEYKIKDVCICFQCADHAVKFPSASWQRKEGWSEVRLVPDLYYFKARGYYDVFPQNGADFLKWENRSSIVLWRGASTGLLNITMDTLSDLPRYRLCTMAKRLGPKISAGITNLVQTKTPEIHEEIHQRLVSEDIFREYIPFREMVGYKYIIDIDGNASAWNLLARLRLGVCLLKVQSPWRQWITAKLLPWVHFVPVCEDLSDLEEKIDWCLSNESSAGEIAKQGREFALLIDFEEEMDEAAHQVYLAAKAI